MADENPLKGLNLEALGKFLDDRDERKAREAEERKDPAKRLDTVLSRLEGLADALEGSRKSKPKPAGEGKADDDILTTIFGRRE